MLARAESYEALRDGFQWDLPERLNMAAQACGDRAAIEPDRLAILDLSDGDRAEISYGDLWQMAARIADALRPRMNMGDRVGVLRAQSGWTAAAHLAIWALGGISIPLFKLFGADALRTRLEDAGATIVIGDGVAHPGLDDWRAGDENRRILVPETLPDNASALVPAETGPETPAVLIYTSGTTGAPKGALHGHRMLTGHLPGVEISHDFLGQPGDVIWTPADWAWIGGLFDVLMPGLVLGVPVVAARLEKFSPDACVDVIARGGVRNVFFPPTALRMLKAADTAIPGLRSVASGGEPLGAEMLAWGRQAFGLEINEFYGQTECNMVASSCGALFPARPSCIGKPVPGFELAVLDDAGALSDGEGDVAIRRGAASMMLEYWNRPDATAEKFTGDWMRTGDRGIWEGKYLRFVGREDDVITSAGYRIGPAEIEDCLLRHPDVATVGVVGKPDALRTEIVKAYVVLKDASGATDTLAEALKSHVRSHLAAHCYPREVAFLDALPMTVTGKVIRKELKRRAVEEEKGAS